LCSTSANHTSEPCALWKAYNSKGAGYLDAYEVKRAAGANKATEARIKKAVQEVYLSVRPKDHGTNIVLRGYMSRVLELPAASLTKGYTRYETYSRKPPPNAESLSTFNLRLWIIKNKITYFQFIRCYKRSNLAEVNFAYKDTNRVRTDVTLKPALSDILLLQYKEQTEALSPNVPLTKLRYLVQANITPTRARGR